MSRSGWNTEDEVEYLKTIGTNHELTKRFSRKEILQKYLRGLNKRRDFGNINRRKVQSVTVRMLKSTK